jgi:hypothetical protein
MVPAFVSRLGIKMEHIPLPISMLNWATATKSPAAGEAGLGPIYDLRLRSRGLEVKAWRSKA